MMRVVISMRFLQQISSGAPSLPDVVQSLQLMALSLAAPMMPGKSLRWLRVCAALQPRPDRLV